MEIQTTIYHLSPVEEENKTKIPVFPQEMVVEILSRLPVKSLCRFRCVSKHWPSLITDPHLAISHLEQTITNARLCSERSRVIIHWTNAYFLDYESIGENDENLVALELGHPIKPTSVSDLSRDKDGFPMFWDISEDGQHIFLVPEQFSDTYKLEIFGICNGLVCLSPQTGIIYLLNPSIREFKRIPDSPYVFTDEHRISQNFGFGYVNDDYKIVKIAAAVFVYSLKADSWRFVCRNPYLGKYVPGVFLNGALHWMAYRGDGDNDCLLAAFDLKEETFFDMPAPNVVESSNDFVVGVLDGYLCVLHMGNGRHNEIWVMNEYGVGESWTRITLGFSYGMGESWTRITLGFSYGVMKPLCFARNGEALFSVNGKLLLYNFDDGSYRCLVIDGIMEREKLFEAEMYFETLVSPNAAVGLEHDAISNLGIENL